jgi:hypothetical protein
LSVIDDIRKVLQDFLAPELTAIKASLDGIAKVGEARFGAEQAQYAALQTNMELIKQQMKNNHDALMLKLDAITREHEKAGTR